MKVGVGGFGFRALGFGVSGARAQKKKQRERERDGKEERSLDPKTYSSLYAYHHSGSLKEFTQTLHYM